MKKINNLLVLPGDGIGQTVTKAIEPLFKILLPNTKVEYGDIGWKFWQSEGEVIPHRSWTKIYKADAILLGATTSKNNEAAIKDLPKNIENKNYISPIIQLRKQLKLYANIRSSYSIKDKYKKFDLSIIRENTEGLYCGFDYYPLPDEISDYIKSRKIKLINDIENASVSLRLQTEKGLKKIYKYAFEYAVKNNKSSVILADKPNVLRQSGDFARNIFFNIAKNYRNIRADIMNVDAVALQLVLKPERFDIIVCENMFGDILSDVAAGVMGGLGLAPSANIGDKYSYFEPVHGSGINMNLDMPNPSAMFLSFALLLNHYGYVKYSKLIKYAVDLVVTENKDVTRDLGGSSSCLHMANKIIKTIINEKNNRTTKSTI